MPKIILLMLDQKVINFETTLFLVKQPIYVFRCSKLIYFTWYKSHWNSYSWEVVFRRSLLPILFPILHFASIIESLKLFIFDYLSIMDKIPPSSTSRAMSHTGCISIFINDIFIPVHKSFIHQLTQACHYGAKLGCFPGHLRGVCLKYIVHSSLLNNHWDIFPVISSVTHQSICIVVKSYDRRKPHEKLHLFFKVIWLHRWSNEHLSGTLWVSYISC